MNVKRDYSRGSGLDYLYFAKDELRDMAGASGSWCGASGTIYLRDSREFQGIDAFIHTGPPMRVEQTHCEHCRCKVTPEMIVCSKCGAPVG
jgi:hypothetical protein